MDSGSEWSRALSLGDQGVELLYVLLSRRHEVKKHGLDMQGSGDLTVNGRTVEVKTDYHSTGNMAWESWSNRSQGREGWAYRATADYLFYIDWPNRVGYRVPMELARKWFLKVAYKYPEARAKKSKPNDSWVKLIPYTDFVNALRPQRYDLSSTTASG